MHLLIESTRLIKWSENIIFLLMFCFWILRLPINLLTPYREKVFTITSDNGKEFAEHQRISKQLTAKVYFAHPYHSWERGLNENTNGLIRQYFPKNTNFKTITIKSVQKVMDRLNNRPRKTLGYATPNEVFFGKSFKHAA